MKTIYCIMMHLVLYDKTFAVNFPFKTTSLFSQDNIKAYTVTNFISKSLTSQIYNKILLTQDIPGFLFVLKYPNYNNQSFSFFNPNFESSLVFYYTKDLTDTKSLIDLMVKLIPLNPRPKCLIFSFDQSPNFESIIKNILRYAWQNKILDFTIIEMDDNQRSPKIYSYNPFASSYKNEELNSRAEIFPNKFENVKNYPIKIGFGENFNKYYTNTPGFEFSSDRQQFLIKFIVQTMNFQPMFLEAPGDLHDYINPQKRHLWFDNTDANMIGELIVVTDSLTRLVVTHAGKECRAVVLVIPRLYTSKTAIPFRVFLLTLVVSGVVFFLLYAMKILKITNEFNGIFDIIRIFVGQSMGNLPKKITSRIFFITSVIMFVYVSNEFYDEIIDLKLNHEEVEFDGFEGLDNSGLMLYTPIQEISYIYSAAYSRSFQNLKNKTKRMDNCIQELKKTQNHICIEWNYDAVLLLKQNSSRDEINYMKIMEPSLFCDDLFLHFEYASPFMERFAVMNRRIIESGIMEIEYFKNNLARINRVELKNPENKRNILNQLLFILASGYIIAILILLIELLL